jgi:hypothetical protein
MSLNKLNIRWRSWFLVWIELFVSVSSLILVSKDLVVPRVIILLMIKTFSMGVFKFVGYKCL